MFHDRKGAGVQLGLELDRLQLHQPVVLALVAELAREADRVVCLSQPGQFHALGHHYPRFPQLSDNDVVSAMDEAAQLYKTGQRHVSGLFQKP